MTRQLHPDTCQQAIIRIFSETGDYFGTGVLTLSGLVVTCSHVIRQALGLVEVPIQPPELNGKVKVDFPFLKDRSGQYDVELATGGWGPEDGWEYENDIAILKLKDIPPFEVGYLFNSDTAREDLHCSIYGFTPSSRQGADVEGTLKPTVNPAGLQVFDTENSAFAADYGFSGGALLPTDRSKGIPQAQGMLIGKNDDHPLLKDMQQQRIVYIIPGLRINKQLLKVTQQQGGGEQNNDLVNAPALIVVARTRVKILAQKKNDAGQFVEAMNDWLDQLEELTTDTEEPGVEVLEGLVHYLYCYQQEAKESGYDQYLSLLMFGDLCPKLNDFVQKLNANGSEGGESLLVENNLNECSDEYLEEIRALQRKIKSRLSMLRSNDIQLEKEKKDKAKAALQSLLHETHQKKINLVIVNRIRQILQELDKSLFEELIMFCQLLLGKYAKVLKLGMVFRDTRDSPEMVMIPPGEFMMGTSGGQADREKKEGPIHRVKISYALAVSIYTVTLADFMEFARETEFRIQEGLEYSTDEAKGFNVRDSRYWKDPGFKQSHDHPVVYVSWDDAQSYVTWLSNRTNRFYSLLSEAEWEYCCRAGTSTQYSWGEEVTKEQANYGSWGGTVPVDRYEPNAWGLYQMHGNVDEWCEDRWHDNYEGAPTDGSAWTFGTDNCVVRGGAWGDDSSSLRSAYREHVSPSDRLEYVGFRICSTSFSS